MSVAAQQVIVVGAGVGGLSAALALARTGHHVLVVERDDTPVPEALGDAFSWPRRGAPQFHHSHAFMPRLRQILRARFPDVYEALLAAGVPDRAATMFGLPDGVPGAQDLVVMPCRRTTYEWVIRDILGRQPNVDIRTGVSVAGVDSRRAGQVTTVTGVTLADGNVLDADAVIATTGRRGDVPGWLAGIGVEIAEETHEAPLSYLSRFYRQHAGAQPGVGYRIARRAGVAYGYFEADDGTFSLTLLPDPTDSELRSHLSDDHRFDATCALLPELAPFLAAADPITPVHVMAGLINRRRVFADERGEPLVERFFALGDAYMVTNPAYGRGCTVAMIQAAALADALAEHPGDPRAQGAAYLSASARDVDPWFHISVLLDQATRSADDGSDFAVGATGGVFSRFTRDIATTVAIARVFCMLDPPERLYTDPSLARVLQRSFTRFQPPTDGVALTRADLLRVPAAAPERWIADGSVPR